MLFGEKKMLSLLPRSFVLTMAIASIWGVCGHSYAQTVTIPRCPSVSEYPKPGAFNRFASGHERSEKSKKVVGNKTELAGRRKGNRKRVKSN